MEKGREGERGRGREREREGKREGKRGGEREGGRDGERERTNHGNRENLLLVYLLSSSIYFRRYEKKFCFSMPVRRTNPSSKPILSSLHITPFPCRSLPATKSRIPSRLPWHQWLHVPNHIRILLDTPITAKEAHPRHTRDTLANPLLLVLVRLIHQLLRLAITAEIITHEVVIAMIDDGVAESGETVGIAKGVGFDGVKHFGKKRVEVEGAVVVGVAEVFNVFGEVAKKEDVGFADFASDFDLFKSVSVVG